MIGSGVAGDSGISRAVAVDTEGSGATTTAVGDDTARLMVAVGVGRFAKPDRA